MRLVATLNNDLEEALKQVQSLRREKVSLENLLLKREEEIIKLENVINKSKFSSKHNATLPTSFSLQLKNSFELLSEDSSMPTSDTFQDSNFPPLQTPKSASRKAQQHEPISNHKAPSSKHNMGKTVTVAGARKVPTPSQIQRKDGDTRGGNSNCNQLTSIDDTLNDSVKDPNKILIVSDSHGRGMSWYIDRHQSTRSTIGFVRPGGKSKEILNERNITSEIQHKDDVLVILCGSNDVAKNEASDAMGNIEDMIKKLKKNKIILVDLPVRYDLPLWSCVNELLKKQIDH